MRFDKKKPNKVREHKINKEIRARSVFLLDKDGVKLGNVPFFTALDKAQEENFDLVQIAVNGDVPVCKIMDYGRFCFEQSKNKQKAKKEQKTNTKKEIKINPVISKNDLLIKTKKVIDCLHSGYKVTVICSFKGRQLDYPNIAFAMMDEIIESSKDCSKIDYARKIDGKTLILNLSPLKVNKEI